MTYLPVLYFHAGAAVYFDLLQEGERKGERKKEREQESVWSRDSGSELKCPLEP